MGLGWTWLSSLHFTLFYNVLLFLAQSAQAFQYDFLLRASIFEMLVLLPFGPVLWLCSQQVLLYIISSDVYQSITGVSVVCI